jgi:hypothetical protein
MKADGTPDMRYSESRRPRNNDGTLDKRYKANKTTTTTKTKQ